MTTTNAIAKLHLRLPHFACHSIRCHLVELSIIYSRGIEAAQAKGDKQAEKEMTVFARRIERSLAG